jgi:hypothetical protein
MPAFDTNSFQQLPPGYNAPAPATPEEEAQRANGWEKLQKALADPTMQMSVLRMGLAMMQPVPVGQSTAGHIASGVGYGLDYLEAKRQQEFQNQQAAQRTQSLTGLQTAQTEQTGAETERTRATTERIQKMTPLEVDEASKKLALLDYKLKSAPNEVERARLEAEKAKLQLDLDTQYGSQDRSASLAMKRAQTGYYAALAASQSGLEAQRKAKAEKDAKIKWKASQIQQDKEDPYRYYVSQYSEDGSNRVVEVRNPMPASEANAQAKAEAKALTDDQLAARYPGMSRDQAASAIGSELMKGHVRVQQFTGPGGEPIQPSGESAPKATPGWDAKAQELPVPASMSTWPDGSGVPDKSGQWWTKHGNVLRRATPDEIKQHVARLGQPSNFAAGKITPAPGQ